MYVMESLVWRKNLSGQIKIYVEEQSGAESIGPGTIIMSSCTLDIHLDACLATRSVCACVVSNLIWAMGLL